MNARTAVLSVSLLALIFLHVPTLAGAARFDSDAAFQEAGSHWCGGGPIYVSVRSDDHSIFGDSFNRDVYYDTC
jgi:hypothetical protein